jgi:hypothetical protein
MSTRADAVVLFELDDTLAGLQEYVDTEGVRKTSFRAVAGADSILPRLEAPGVRLGVLFDRESATVDDVRRVLKSAGMYSAFDRDLLLPVSSTIPRRFEEAASRVAHLRGRQQPAPRVLYVSTTATLRVEARTADLLTAPHPALAMSVLLQAGPLRYLRIRVPLQSVDTDWAALLRDLPLVPLQVSMEPAGDLLAPAVYAIADPPTAARLDDLGFWVDRLGEDDEPQTTDLYILRDDKQLESGFGIPAGNASAVFGRPPSARRVLASTHEGLVVAIPAGRSVGSYHFEGTRHGHNLKLLPSPTLLEPEDGARSLKSTTDVCKDPEGLAASLKLEEKEVLCRVVNAGVLREDVECYTGVRKTRAGTLICSRHIDHPHNEVAVSALEHDLKTLGKGRLDVQTPSFRHGRNRLKNVEATLHLPGADGVVIVSAHLDSTAIDTPGYDAPTHRAPGADDDASGMAGVLGAARAILELDEKFKNARRRDIRFLFFNAEEEGKGGSVHYAGNPGDGGPIMAVFQMDMIGYKGDRKTTWELHAGCESRRKVESRAICLTRLVSSLARQVSPGLELAQLFPEGRRKDPAEGSSDHTSFLTRLYPACVASEDFHPRPGNTTEDANPHYHKNTDEVKEIDPCYAADIARAVAAAAWITATR